MVGLAVAWICGLLIAKWQLPFGKSIFILIYFILISILILKLKKEPSWLNFYVHEKRYPQMTVFFLCIPFLFSSSISKSTFSKYLLNVLNFSIFSNGYLVFINKYLLSHLGLTLI